MDNCFQAVQKAGMLKLLFATVAFILTFVAFYPYYRAIGAQQIRPHVFTWFIWGAGTLIVFFAQLSDGAGLGAWPVGISAFLTAGVAVWALANSADASIVRSDWVFFGLALSALPLWFFTSTALSAVVILTLVDMLGFGPTVRKAYFAPHQESAQFFAISFVRNILIILALENLSWTTALFPAAVGLASGLFLILIMMRRQTLKPLEDSAAP